MDLFVHWFVPTLVALAFLRFFGTKKILFLSPLAVLPDLDALLMHRLFLHNVFLAVLLPLVLFFVFSHKGKKQFALLSLLAMFFLTSHVLLDSMWPGVALLYPFSDKLFFFDFRVDYNWFSGVIQPMLKFGAIDASFLKTVEFGQIVPSYAVFLSAIALFALLLKYSLAKKK